MNSSANRRPTNRQSGPRRSRPSASKATEPPARAEPLQDGLERAEHAVFVCDVQPTTQGKSLPILLANPASRALTGLDPSEAVAKDLVSLLLPKRESVLRGRLADLVRAGNPTIVGAIRRKVGRATREFELAAIPLSETDERATPWVFVVRNVTAQQQDGGWTLRPNHESTGDTVFTHDDRRVLLMDEGVSKAMMTMALDVRQTQSGPRLTLRRNSKRGH